jgi:hypothetical protein
MRLSLAWFSVRRLMIVVAVIAALVWAGMECVGLWERARHYNSLAATYATMQRWAQEEAARKQARIARFGRSSRRSTAGTMGQGIVSFARAVRVLVEPE